MQPLADEPAGALPNLLTNARAGRGPQDPKLPAAAAGGAVKEADMDPSGSWTTQTTACSSTFGTFEDLPAWHFAVEAAPSPPPVAPDGPLEGAAAGSTFSVFCAGTRLGFHVRVVGSCEELGRWRPERGLPLHTSAARFPMWYSEERLVLEADTEYKYVVCDSNGKAEQWEEHRNRRVGRRAGRTAVISETFNARSDFDESASSTCPDQAARFKRSASLALRVLQATRKFKRPLLPLREHLRELEAQLSPCYSDVASPSPSPSESPSPTAFAGDRPTPAAFAHIFSPTTGALKATAAEAGAAQHAAAAKPQRPRLRREQSCCDVEPDADGEAAGPGAAFGDQFDLAGQGPLGEGSFGVVWQCVRRRGHDGQSMAAKVMKKQRLSEQDYQNIMGPGGEVEVHMGLRHSNVVALFAHFDEEHTITLVMEQCSGGDLFDAVADYSRVGCWGLPEEDTVFGARQMLSGIKYLHSLRVVHRDLKCENMLLAKRGVNLQENVLKICDFGFAAFDHGDGLTDRMGSPDTVAPEVITGQTYSLPVDLWAMGVIFYMMLSAKSPFSARNDVEVLRKVRAGRYTFGSQKWGGVSDRAKAAIASLLVLRPDLRPDAPGALALPWLA